VGQTPRGRAGNLAEIADAIVFTTSERPGFLTGQTIFFDGGISRRPDSRFRTAPYRTMVLPAGPGKRTVWHSRGRTVADFSTTSWQTSRRIFTLGERSAEPGARDCCLPGNGPIGHRGNGATPAHDGRTGRRSGASPRLTTDGSGPTSRVAKHVAKEREGIEVDEALGDQPILKREAIAAGHVELASSARRRNVEFDVDVRPGGRVADQERIIAATPGRRAKIWRNCRSH